MVVERAIDLLLAELERKKLGRAERLDLIRGGKSSVAWSAPLDHLLREAAQLLTR